MATIKAYTDLEQSKELAKILSLESADMHYWHKGQILGVGHSKELQKGFESKRIDYIPCWSLAALSEFILPYIADNDGNNYKFYLSKDGLDRWIAYYKSDNVSIHICEESDNMIDVILEMVCWLKNEEYI